MFAPAYCPRCGGEVAAPVVVGGVERTADWHNGREANVQLEVSFYTARVPHRCQSKEPS